MQLEDAPSASVGQALVEIARRSPGNLAIRSPRFQLSYADMLDCARRIACGPAFSNARSHVGILAEHDAPGIAAMCGALIAARPFVPIDPAWPTARSGEVLIDAECDTLLADAANLESARAAVRACGADTRVECIEDALEQAPEFQPVRTPESLDALACILYTSGSTGAPKGVMHTHRSLLRGTEGLIQAARVSPADRLTLLAPLAYAAPQSQLLAALLSGAAVAPYDVRRDGIAPMAGWIAETGVTVYHSVAAVLRELVQGLDDPRLLSSLRLIRLGGGPAAPSDADILQTLPQACQLWTNYAATEHWLGLYSMIDRNTPLDRDLSRIPLQTAMAGVEVLLLDDDDQSVAEGTPGELLMASETLSSGYWRDPELTAARFTVDPRTGDGRMYRTRDLGRRLSDGSLLHMGRKDDLVKIRGMRVDPSEVAAALARHPRVAEAAVLASDDGHGQPMLVGYVAARPQTQLSTAEVHRYALEHLLSAMVPTRYAVVERLPHTPHGKLDRAALRQIGASPPNSVDAWRGRPPKTPVELALADIWRAVLDVHEVTVEDDFFDSGGHSLLAARLFADVEDHFGVRLPLTSLFPRATLGALAEQIASARGGMGEVLVPIQPDGILPPLICVHPLDGDVLRFAALARWLGKDQPVFALRSPGLSQPGTRCDDIGDLADIYVQYVLATFCTAPICLAGFSFGGPVAVEMARRLIDSGGSVPFVGLLDAPAPGRPTRAPLRAVLEDVVHYSRFKLERARTMGLRGLQGEKDILETIGAFSPEHLAVAIDHRRAFQRARPGWYAGKLVLFRARVRPYSSRHDPSLGWSRQAQEVEVHTVPGLHEQILQEPHVAVLARELRNALARARGVHSTL